MITVTPTTFEKVEYDADVLASWAQAALERVLGAGRDLDVEIRVDENAATTTATLVSLDPIRFEVDGGAVENLRDPRRMGEHEASIVFTRLFLEVYDRNLAVFGAPAMDDEVSQRHRMAWDVNLFGRVARLGLELHEPRYRYNFRNRHGFSDHADAMFDELWNGGDTTWRRITAWSDAALDPSPTDAST